MIYLHLFVYCPQILKVYGKIVHLLKKVNYYVVCEDVCYFVYVRTNVCVCVSVCGGGQRTPFSVIPQELSIFLRQGLSLGSGGCLASKS